jgi:hypothetical protein
MVLAAMILCAAVVVGLLTQGPVRGAVEKTLKQAGFAPILNRLKAGPAPAPAVGVQLLSPDRLTARRHVVVSLHRALERNDFQQGAFLNSILAQEAFHRAYRTLKAWEKYRDSETGLVPRNGGAKRAFWNAKDAAADLFPFLLLASQYVDVDNEGLWLNTLRKEREICGPMPCTIYLQPTRVIKEELAQAIFGAAEYAKDGLLPLAERSGPGAWFARLEEIAQALLRVAHVDAKTGKIPASDTEVNGDMLQVLVRLYWATKKPEYLEMAERIAEAYLFDILPQHHYLPPREWHLPTGSPESRYFGFRDHGNEIIPGLAELYLLERLHRRPQALLYRNALKSFYDRILEVGRTDDGLWYNVIDIRTGKSIDNEVVDTWGYILNALQTFDLAEGTSIYAKEIRRAMRAAAARKSFPWEGPSHDGYADAIESMLYLLPWFDDPEYHRWIDDEIEVMFHMQSPGGTISGGYLDGNFNRTALLYATYKTRGIIAYPWREDIYLGAAYDGNKKDLYIYLSAGTQWKGVLKFDLPRHRTIWNLPLEYPRLNGTPEWFVVDPEKNYAVVNLKTGERSVHSGRVLAEGLEMKPADKDSALSLKISGPVDL